MDVRCKIVNATDANKPRELSAEEATTRVGLAAARSKPGGENSVAEVGFAVQGPVVLLGTPEDNPLIKFLLDNRFLPYQPAKATFPGYGRGLYARQYDGVGHGQESVTLIAYDAAGMAEAVGSVVCSRRLGIDRVNLLTPPADSSVSPATKVTEPAPAAPIAWQAPLPDRALRSRPRRTVK
ncbi:MAG: hypothetical protein WKG07_33815 [Hymenobacter sp.]